MELFDFASRTEIHTHMQSQNERMNGKQMLVVVSACYRFHSVFLVFVNFGEGTVTPISRGSVCMQTFKHRALNHKKCTVIHCSKGNKWNRNGNTTTQMEEGH